MKIKNETNFNFNSKLSSIEIPSIEKVSLIYVAKLNTKIFDELTIFYVFFRKLSTIANNKKTFIFFFHQSLIFSQNITPRCAFSNFSKVSSKEIVIQIDFPKRDQILGLFLGIFLRRGKIKRTGRDKFWTYEKRCSNFSKRYLLLKEIENKRSLQIIVKNIVFLNRLFPRENGLWIFRKDHAISLSSKLKTKHLEKTCSANQWPFQNVITAISHDISSSDSKFTYTSYLPTRFFEYNSLSSTTFYQFTKKFSFFQKLKIPYSMEDRNATFRSVSFANLCGKL